MGRPPQKSAASQAAPKSPTQKEGASVQQESPNNSASQQVSVSKCKTCHVNLERRKVKRIDCDICDSSYCLKCSKVNPSLFDEIVEDDSLIWTCPCCKVAVPGIKRILVAMTKLQEKINVLEQKLGGMAASQQDADATNQVGAQHETIVHDSVQDAVQKALLEEREIESRKFNLIVQALPESENEADDVVKAKALINDKLRCNVELINCVRVGKKSQDKPRLLRFSVKDFASKRAILDVSKNLKNDTEYSNVYITPDLTKNQRQHAFLLRQEKRRRENAGEENLAIRKGRIVTLPPRPQVDEHNYTRPPTAAPRTASASGGGGGSSFQH